VGVYYGLLRGVSAARRLNRSALGGQANPGLVVGVYYGLLRGVSAARRLNRSALGGQANPGLVWPPAKTISHPRIV